MQNGLHGWEDHFLFEVIDPDTMQPKPMGEAGELVITTLTKEALPMIRYRTRDITRLSDEPCACGRTHVRILRVTGRNDDMLIIRGVNVYPSQIEAVLVGFPGIAPHYQIVLTREGALDAMTVEVELAPDFTGDRTRKAQEVTHHIKSLIGVTCTVVPKATGEVPRSQGKAVRSSTGATRRMKRRPQFHGRRYHIDRCAMRGRQHRARTAVAVERREAPSPPSMGARAPPDARRVRQARQGGIAPTPWRPPGAPFLSWKRKKGSRRTPRR